MCHAPIKPGDVGQRAGRADRTSAEAQLGAPVSPP